MKGTFNCDVKAGENVTNSEFVVIKGKGVPLLGRHTAMALKVLKIGVDVATVTDDSPNVQLKKQYPTVFKGVGKLKSRQVTLHKDPSVQPVAQPVRRIPFS